ncbi:hypothetical protein BGX38DRAFT_1261223 [Terfezia claveryi]|nr:hypothetical protein BGX38DRAFT_1261223 [Terfezia claveryi]
MPHPIFFGELVTKAEDLAISSPVVYPEGPEGVTIVVKPTPIAGSGVWRIRRLGQNCNETGERQGDQGVREQAMQGIIGPVTMGDENSNKKRKSKWFTYIHRIATCPRHKRKTN